MPGHQPIRPSDFGGLVVIMAGLVMYRFHGTLSAGWRYVATAARYCIAGDLDSAKDSLAYHPLRRRDSLSENVGARALAYVGINQGEALMAGQ